MRDPEVNSTPFPGGCAKTEEYFRIGIIYHSQERDKGKSFQPHLQDTAGLNQFKALEYFLSRNLPGSPPTWVSFSSEGPKPQLYPFNPHHV